MNLSIRLVGQSCRNWKLESWVKRAIQMEMFISTYFSSWSTRHRSFLDFSAYYGVDQHFFITREGVVDHGIIYRHSYILYRHDLTCKCQTHTQSTGVWVLWEGLEARQVQSWQPAVQLRASCKVLRKQNRRFAKDDRGGHQHGWDVFLDFLNILKPKCQEPDHGQQMQFKTTARHVQAAPWPLWCEHLWLLSAPPQALPLT